MIEEKINIEPVYDYRDEIVAYKLINLFSPITLTVFNEFYLEQNWINETESSKPPDNIIPHDNFTLGLYNDALSISILNTLTPVVSNILKKDVLPSYTYSRVYTKNTELISHRDRDSCEISLTLNIFQTGSEIEKFYVSDKDKKHCLPEEITTINTNMGDAILFWGQDNSNGSWHWRDPTRSDEHLQSFLHWVYADGKYKDNAFEWKK